MAVLEEEPGYSWTERLLFYTLPVLFTILLTGVLLTVFGYDVAQELLRIGNRIPVVSALLPDPKPSEAANDASPAAMSDAELLKEMLAAAEEDASRKESEIAEMRAVIASKEEQIEKLTAELEAMQRQAAEEAASAEEYAQSIQSIARVYAGMKASKAAAVLENLTLSERVLVLREMSEEEQMRILERMNPAIAAETSILMKDAVEVKDLQIAALQERLVLNDRTEDGKSLTIQELSRTFAMMSPELAAEVLLEMELALAVDILRNMDEGARAGVMNALAEMDSGRTAQISARLG